MAPQSSSLHHSGLVPGWLDRRLFPFESHWLQLAGHTIHYLDEGHGPTLLLLHGNLTWSFLYRHLVPKLAPHYRCIALDYPGFGLSTAGPGYGFTPREHSQVVEQVVEHLGLCDLRVMVQDWGGPIGLGFAGRRPDLIHSLIIGNTFAWPAQGGMVAFSKLFGSSLFRWLNRHYNLIARLLIPAGMNRQLTEAELAAYLGPFATPASRLPTWILPREITHSHAYLAEVEAGLAKLREKPALLIWGEADGAFREPDRRRLQQHLPAHQVLLLPQVKHFIQENAPQEISTAILAHERRTAIPVA